MSNKFTEFKGKVKPKYVVLVGLVGLVGFLAVDRTTVDQTVSDDEFARIYSTPQPVRVDSQKSANTSGPTTTKEVSTSPVVENPEFVVAPDYNTVRAAEKMITMALNEDVTAAWVGLRLAANAQREKSNIALLEMQEAKSRLEKAKYEQQTAAIKSGEMDVNGEGLVMNKSEYPTLIDATPDDIRVMAFSSGGSSSGSSAIIVLNGKVVKNVRKGQMVGAYFVSELDARSKCVSLGKPLQNSPSIKSYCL